MIGEFPAKLSKFCLVTPHSGDQEWSPSRRATRDVGGRSFLTAVLRHAQGLARYATHQWRPLHRIPHRLLFHDKGRQRRCRHSAIGDKGRFLGRRLR